MLICPKCKCEYQEGYTVCNDCKCELIEILDIPEEDTLAKNNSKIGEILILSAIFAVFVIGIIILMSSLKLGNNEMSNIMQTHGVIMGTNEYIIYLEQSIIKYRVVGSILSLLGGIGVLLIINSKS